ncbi:MAG: hypothetical protein U1E65_25640 [Myxococcota bacterium]
MSSPFTPPEDETAAVPPNRARPASGTRTLILWLVLMLMFVALYQILGSPRGSAHPTPAPPPAAQGAPLGFLLMPLPYALMVLGLLGLRRRLPPEYRTWQVRELKRPEAASPAPAANPAPIDRLLQGRSGGKKVELRVDAAGLHWRTEARLLEPARELHIAWDELESISVGRTPSALRVWGVLLGLSGAYAFVRAPLLPFLVASGAGIALALLGGRGRQGTLHLVTATHALYLESKSLEPALQEEIMNAARGRRPQAVAAPTTKKNNALFVLFLEPWTSLWAAGLSDQKLRHHLMHQGSMPDPDHALAHVGRLQYRMFAIWRGVLIGLGPACTAACTSVGLASLPALFGAWVFSYIVGFTVLAKSTNAFARFSGMSVVR